MVTGIMQISPAPFVGDLANTLPQYIPPLSVAGATGRWEMAYLTTGEIGDDLAIWPAAGVGPDLTTTGASGSATAPLLVDDGGGNLAVQFDGTLDALGASFATPQPNTMVVVGRILGGTNVRALMSGGLNGSPYAQVLGLSNANLPRAYDGTGLDRSGVTLGSGFHVWLGVFNGESSVIRFDASEATGNAGTSGAGASIVLGGSGIVRTNCEIKAAAYYPFALDGTERSAIVAELADRYGI